MSARIVLSALTLLLVASAGDAKSVTGARVRQEVTCNGTGMDSLNNGTGNEVSGMDSAALGGQGNRACDDAAGIGAGDADRADAEDDSAEETFTAGGGFNQMLSSLSFLGAGASQMVPGHESAVFAGLGNTPGGGFGFIGAGTGNGINSASLAAIAAGDVNTIEGDGSDAENSGGQYGFIGAGYGNTITGALDGYAQSDAIAAGYKNAISGKTSAAEATSSAIAGGAYSTVTGSYTSILGGARNSASGQYAAIAGGYGNAAPGEYASVLGGDGNGAAGTLSIAGGYRARAAHDGSFVWSDYVSGSAMLPDTAKNQFIVRSSGGVTFSSNEAMTAGVRLSSGSGVWSSLSDRNAKSAFAPIADGAVLAKLAALPITEWRYASERGARHIGPMAQDFYAAFGIGADDRHVSSIDEGGVALAAVEALDRAMHRSDAAIRAQARYRRQSRETQLRSLEARVARLEASLATVAGPLKVAAAPLTHGKRR